MLKSLKKFLRGGGKMLNAKKAQSTLEYIIIFTVIVGAILWAANNLIRGRMQNILNHVTSEAEQAVNHIDF
jgi:hypothetical protein